MTITNTTKIATILDGLPGMIEASEARGQRQLVASTLLPADMGRQRPIFERMGFKFGEVVKDDPLFIHAELPTGWQKKATDHAMWSDIVDERGAKRVGVFYKAAFYDRRADMHLVGRYDIEYPWDQPKETPTATAKVIDKKTGAVLYEVTKERGDGKNSSDRSAYVAREAAQEWCKANLPDDEIEAWFVD
jgi:hypothetical protein